MLPAPVPPPRDGNGGGDARLVRVRETQELDDNKGSRGGGLSRGLSSPVLNRSPITHGSGLCRPPRTRPEVGWTRVKVEEVTTLSLGGQDDRSRLGTPLESVGGVSPRGTPGASRRGRIQKVGCERSRSRRSPTRPSSHCPHRRATWCRTWELEQGPPKTWGAVLREGYPSESHSPAGASICASGSCARGRIHSYLEVLFTEELSGLVSGAAQIGGISGASVGSGAFVG